MIRAYEEEDFQKLAEIHAATGLPLNCFPKIYVEAEIDGEKQTVMNALYIEKNIMEVGEELVMGCFLKVTGEVYLLLDHSKGTPEDRWEWLQEMRDYMVDRAKFRGFDEVTCWIPRELEESFGPRLLELGFVRSKWQSFTFKLD